MQTESRVFVRLTGPNESLDAALGALEAAGIGSIAIVLGDERSPPWIEIEQSGTSAAVEAVCRQVETLLVSAGVAGFEILESGTKAVRLPQAPDS